MKRTYYVQMREPRGGSHTAMVIAETDCEAHQLAAGELADWVADGEWGIEGATINASYRLRWWGKPQTDWCDWVSVVVDIPFDEAALMREAGADPDCAHEWTSEGEGGDDANPGVWSTGGTGIVVRAHCRHCQLVRLSFFRGSQRNPGDHDTVAYHRFDEGEDEA